MLVLTTKLTFGQSCFNINKQTLSGLISKGQKIISLLGNLNKDV